MRKHLEFTLPITTVGELICTSRYYVCVGVGTIPFLSDPIRITAHKRWSDTWNNTYMYFSCQEFFLNGFKTKYNFAIFICYFTKLMHHEYPNGNFTDVNLVHLNFPMNMPLY